MILKMLLLLLFSGGLKLLDKDFKSCIDCKHVEKDVQRVFKPF